MKNLVAKLKGTNYKQALIDHGEKMILGVIGFFVLICLAGTSWSRYDKQPEEFKKKVEQGEAAIRSSAWTVEKQAEFKSSRDIMQAVEMLHSSLDTSRYVYSTNWFWPMYSVGTKYGEPKWLAPREPIANDGKVVIIENPEPPKNMDVAVLEDKNKADAKKIDEDDDFAPRRPAANDPASTGGAPVGAAQAGIIADSGANSANNYQIPGMVSSGSGSSGPVVNARGVRFVAIRSVFPLSDQLDELVKAMHLTKPQAAELIEFMDFEVERQVAQPGDKPWSGDWEKVDFQATLELLERVDYDTEVVDIAWTDAVFTMPLPRRVAGTWKRYASHPLIKAMSDEQVELQARTLEEMLKNEEALKKTEKAQKKGLAKSQVDGRALRSQFDSGQMQNMLRGVQKDVNADLKDGSSAMYSTSHDPGMLRNMADPSFMSGFQDQVTRNNGRMSKYLLLRYFDFQVTPGNAYRYRLRVTLRNPNFRRPVEELVDEATAAGELRTTPWSEPTPAVYVKNEEHIFLAKADKAKIETGLPSAYLDVYQWFSEAGTMIAAKLEKLQLGQFVGGRPPKTEVFRPAQNTLQDEEIPVFTGSVLADVVAVSTSDIDLSEHADLKLDTKKLNQLGVVGKALLVDRSGQLITLDPKSSTDELAQAQEVVERERRAIRAAIKERPEQTGASSDLDRLRRAGGGGASSAGGFAGATPDDPMGIGMMGGGMGKGNPLKKGGAKSSKKPPKGGMYQVNPTSNAGQ